MNWNPPRFSFYFHFVFSPIFRIFLQFNNVMVFMVLQRFTTSVGDIEISEFNWSQTHTFLTRNWSQIVIQCGLSSLFIFFVVRIQLLFDSFYCSISDPVGVLIVHFMTPFD